MKIIELKNATNFCSNPIVC